MSGANYLAKIKPKRVRPQTDYLHIDNLFEHRNQAIDKENQAIGDKNMAIEAE